MTIRFVLGLRVPLRFCPLFFIDKLPQSVNRNP